MVFIFLIYNAKIRLFSDMTKSEVLKNVKIQRVTRWYSMFHVKHRFWRFFCFHLCSFRCSSHTAPTERQHNARELVFHITRARVGMCGGRVLGCSGHGASGGRKVRAREHARVHARAHASAPVYEAFAKKIWWFHPFFCIFAPEMLKTPKS